MDVKKMTAVEWYAVKDGELTIQYLEGKINGIQLAVQKTKCFHQAIAMEKQQHFNSYRRGNLFLDDDVLDFEYYFEQYYKYTYGN